ncbi:MAG: nickel-dependent hydrogenase large subunit [Magnetospirillum sp.]|nr:nickel-dependent hydrogenase large subunit [Magnetospirillum sp.]
MLPLEAGITVTLTIRECMVGGVTLVSTRLPQASRLLAGRTPAEVMVLLPSLFSLCGTAQGLAGLEAMELAAGIVSAPAQRMARRFLLLAETIAEHAMGIIKDWPALLGEEADLAQARPLRPLVTAAKRALYPDGDWSALGGGRLAPDRGALTEILRQVEDMAARLFGGSPEEWLDDYTVFRSWIHRHDGVAARLLSSLEARNLSGFGRSPLLLMPDSGPRDLAERLAADSDGSYCRAPHYCGHVFETNALARLVNHPVMAGLVLEYGNGLASRFAARLIEIATALQEQEDLVQDLCEDSGHGPARSGEGIGLGIVDAARGLLVHRVELEGGTLRDYRILAPTEWNFHPDGPLVRSLKGSPAGTDLEAKARLLAAALDPCVPCRVEIAAHA